jgi:hypothetical protein
VSCPVNYGNRKVWAKSNDLICLLLQNRSTASTAAFTPKIMGTHADDGGKIRIVSLTARLF